MASEKGKSPILGEHRQKFIRMRILILIGGEPRNFRERACQP